MLSNEIQYDEYCKTRFSLQENSSLRDHLLLLLSCSGWESIFSWTKNYWLVCYNWVERNFTAEGLDSTLASAKNKKTSLKLHRSCSLSLFFFPAAHMSYDPRPGIESQTQLQPMSQLWWGWILNPLHQTGDGIVLLQRQHQILNPLYCRGNSLAFKKK